MGKFVRFVKDGPLSGMTLTTLIDKEARLRGISDVDEHVRDIIESLRSRSNYMCDVDDAVAGVASQFEEKVLVFCNDDTWKELRQTFDGAGLPEKPVSEPNSVVVPNGDTDAITILRFREGLGLHTVREVVRTIRNDHRNRVDFGEMDLDDLHTHKLFKDANLPALTHIPRVGTESRLPLAVFLLAEGRGIIEYNDAAGTFKYREDQLISELRGRANVATKFPDCTNYRAVLEAVAQKWDTESEAQNEEALKTTTERLEERRSATRQDELRELFGKHLALMKDCVRRFQFREVGNRKFEEVFGTL